MQTQECYYRPLFKISIQYLVRKSFPADSNAFQNTVTSQLVQNKLVIHKAYDSATQGYIDFSSIGQLVFLPISTLCFRNYLGSLFHWE